MAQTFEIPLSRLETILKRHRRLTKRHKAAGLPVPTVEVLSHSFRETEVRDALARLRGEERNVRNIRVKTVKIAVDGFTAPIGEWDIIGWRWHHVIRTMRDERSVLGSSPEVPKAIAERLELACDHCEAKRNRTSSYVVTKVDGTGEPLEVGASCMESFLGSPSAGVLSGLSDNAMLYAEIARIAAEDFLLSPEDIADEVDTVLAVATSIISNQGFVPTKEACEGNPPTWHAVYEDVRLYRAPHLDDSDLTVTMADFMTADSIIEWARSEEAGPSHNPFISKVRQVIDNGISNPGDIAVLTALAASHRRYLAEATTRDRIAETRAGSSYVGMIDERCNMVVAVLSVIPYRGHFGEGDVITMSEGGGNLIQWFSSKRSHGLKSGSTYEITATVKKHERSTRGDYEGALQTVINRVSVVQDLGLTVVREPKREEDEDSREFSTLIGFLAPARR
jgi:hypothetical protein|nr:hypothetical protein [Neorhizobium tomejilense]